MSLCLYVYQWNCALECVWLFSDHRKGMTSVQHIHLCIFTLILETWNNTWDNISDNNNVSVLKEIRD